MSKRQRKAEEKKEKEGSGGETKLKNNFFKPDSSTDLKGGKKKKNSGKQKTSKRGGRLVKGKFKEDEEQEGGAMSGANTSKNEKLYSDKLDESNKIPLNKDSARRRSNGAKTSTFSQDISQAIEKRGPRQPFVFEDTERIEPSKNQLSALHHQKAEDHLEGVVFNEGEALVMENDGRGGNGPQGTEEDDNGDDFIIDDL